MGPQVWISYTYSGGGGAGKHGVPCSWCHLGNVRRPANSRSYLSFLSMANETMKIICLEM